jgi:hypothetical protein
VPFLLHILAACGDEDPPRPPDPFDTRDTAGPAHSAVWSTFTLPGDLRLAQRDTYTFTPTWRLAASEIRARADLQLQWTEKTVDAWGQARAADSFDTLVLIRARTDRADALDRLSRDDLEPVTTGRWETSIEGRTVAFLSDLEGFDVARLREDDSLTWLLLLADLAGPRLDLRDGVILVPKIDRERYIVLPISDGVATTSWETRFPNEPLATDEGHEVYTLAWSDLETDAYGKPSDPGRTDEVFVGRFDQVDEADDLAGQVLELQAAADGWWTWTPPPKAPVGAAVLSDATDGAGERFPGFTADTRWLVGGRCTTCFGPAPLWLAEVEARVP